MIVQHLSLDLEGDKEVIIVKNISKRFKIPHEKKNTLFENIASVLKGNLKSDYEEFWVLKDISFSVMKGETLGIIGENGSGKSTLLKLIANVIWPEIGSITVNGKIAPFLELGVGFQQELTAKDNIYLYGAIMGLTKKEINKKYDEIIDFAELKKFEDSKLKNFSSGMYLRLAFSTAIATNPDIFLIDEVLAVGDEPFQEKCLLKFEEFKNEGKTIILVSHNLDLINNICDQSLLLNNGKIVYTGKSQKVISEYYKILDKKKH